MKKTMPPATPNFSEILAVYDKEGEVEESAPVTK